MDKIAKAMRDMGQAQAQIRRDKARVSAMKRKEEYLGARVPGELRAQVIARANELGIPVSILIRNILEEAFASVTTGVESAPVAARAGTAVQRTMQKPDYPSVIGWEQITLNRSMICTGCAREIEAGARVTLGLTSPGEDHVILCGNCKTSD